MIQPTSGIISRYKVLVLSVSTILLGISFLYLSIVLSIRADLSALLKSLGTVFVPSGFLALINQYTLRESFRTDMREDIQTALDNQFQAIKEIKAVGIREIHESMPQAKIIKLISQATKNVRILQTWIPDLQVFEMALVNAVNNGAKIQILILDPNSDFAKQRSLDLGYKDAKIGGKNVQTNIADLERIIKKSNISNNIELRLYNVLPSLHIYSSDDISLIGFFWHGVPSKLGYGFEVNGREYGFGYRLHQEFEQVWNLSKKIDVSSK